MEISRVLNKKPPFGIHRTTQDQEPTHIANKYYRHTTKEMNNQKHDGVMCTDCHCDFLLWCSLWSMVSGFSVTSIQGVVVISSKRVEVLPKVL